MPIAHGTERGWHLHKEPSGYAESRVERYCAHCEAWIPVHGVTGALAFMAHHDDHAADPAAQPAEPSAANTKE